MGRQPIEAADAILEVSNTSRIIGVQHPNIVSVICHVPDPGGDGFLRRIHAIVFELCTEGSLLELIQARQRPPQKPLSPLEVVFSLVIFYLV